MNIIHIITGQVRKALKINQSIHDERIERGCKRCALAYRDGRYTGYCSKKGGGCGCDMAAKTRDPNLKCPQGVWAHDWFKQDVLDALNEQHNFVPSESTKNDEQ